MMKKGEQVTIVRDGKAKAVVVTADVPSPTASYAAEELVDHIEKATGVRMEVIQASNLMDKSECRIFVGLCAANHCRDIRPEELGPDEYVLRVQDGDLYVVGDEDPEADPLDEDTAYSGTLFGVYDLLERCLGVRWLWPGELGTHVPHTDTLVIEGDLDEQNSPRLPFRRFAWYQVRRAAENYDPDIERLGFSHDGLCAYRDDLGVYLRRHRMGYSQEKPPTEHHFSGWWDRYGEEHPEWFMMRSDGGRGPAPDASERERSHVAMCVSNPDLHRFIVEEDWDGGPYLPLGEVDVRVFCQCEDCLAWDGPQPEDPPEFAEDDYRPRMVSERYARFWKTIREMAAAENPEVKVTTFLYWNYLPAPLGDIELDENIYGEFVPWTGVTAYYPMPGEAQNWLREQWLGWKEKGIAVAYRPNYFHGGYVMPHISTYQAGEFFKFAYRNGMEGFRYDSLFGHWAVKGPMLYIHMRLGWDPEQDIETLRGEYFSAFGPAAEQVERYFDYWEDYARARPGGSLYNPVSADQAYPPQVFRPAEELLNRALEVACKDPHDEYARRVEFLQAGLEHARLAAQFMGTLQEGKLPSDSEDLKKASKALTELVEFRRDHEELYIADFLDASRRENRRVDIDALLSEE